MNEEGDQRFPAILFPLLGLPLCSKLCRWICFSSGKSKQCCLLRRASYQHSRQRQAYSHPVGTRGILNRVSSHNSVYRKGTAGYRKNWKSRLVLQRQAGHSGTAVPAPHGQQQQSPVLDSRGLCCLGQRGQGSGLQRVLCGFSWSAA